MNKTEILDILEENGLSEIEELKSEQDLLLVKFYFDFDKDVLAAAKEYANTESEQEEKSKEWYNQYFLPYLYDFANDEVLEIVEEIIDDAEDLSGEIMAFQIDMVNTNYVQFMALFTTEENSVAIEEVVKEFIG